MGKGQFLKTWCLDLTLIRSQRCRACRKEHEIRDDLVRCQGTEISQYEIEARRALEKNSIFSKKTEAWNKGVKLRVGGRRCPAEWEWSGGPGQEGPLRLSTMIIEKQLQPHPVAWGRPPAAPGGGGERAGPPTPQVLTSPLPSRGGPRLDPGTPEWPGRLLFPTNRAGSRCGEHRRQKGAVSPESSSRTMSTCELHRRVCPRCDVSCLRGVTYANARHSKRGSKINTNGSSDIFFPCPRGSLLCVPRVTSPMTTSQLLLPVFPQTSPVGRAEAGDWCRAEEQGTWGLKSLACMTFVKMNLTNMYDYNALIKKSPVGLTCAVGLGALNPRF